ncbi:hypothetical protein [Bradyrhizobium elkanii]|uniref:hypothetical protein n=1 Tax=Bradyrhizobium elkanii TaxID=29448 RepID=UPI0020A0B38D|nr:hypothetical protein [Bradyrhizobium elkanii]MCP1974306.1 hypothetical protein [Bradyrhizobium elkanii]MCS4104189.1 hypothetical protein [Bradyrhizobium elkanii]
MWDDAGNYIHKYVYGMIDHPDCDFLWDTEWNEKWTKRLFWTAEEAAALSFGRSPDKVPWNADPWGVKEMDGSSEFASYFCQLRKEIIKAQENTILPRAIPALMYIQWADANNIPFPPALAQTINQFYGSLTRESDKLPASDEDTTTSEKNQELGKRSRNNDGEVHPRLKNNYLKLILAVAREKYHHPRPGAAKRMSETMDKQGFSLDEDTILNYLTTAERVHEPVNPANSHNKQG